MDNIYRYIAHENTLDETVIQQGVVRAETPEEAEIKVRDKILKHHYGFHPLKVTVSIANPTWEDDVMVITNQHLKLPDSIKQAQLIKSTAC